MTIFPYMWCTTLIVQRVFSFVKRMNEDIYKTSKFTWRKSWSFSEDCHKITCMLFYNCSHFNFYSNPINFWNVRISEKKRKKKAFRSKTERKKIASKLNAWHFLISPEASSQLFKGNGVWMSTGSAGVMCVKSLLACSGLNSSAQSRAEGVWAFTHACSTFCCFCGWF